MTRHAEGRAGLLHGLRAHHVGFLEMLGRLLPALEHDHAALLRDWFAFEVSVLTHFDAEERLVLSHLTLVDPRSAAAMQREHDLLRNRLASIRGAIESHTVVAAHLMLLASELRAHAKHEHLLLESVDEVGQS